ncbi:MAG: hypothetical protein AAF581_14145 [Planctomycetota bacterium]
MRNSSAVALRLFVAVTCGLLLLSGCQNTSWRRTSNDRAKTAKVQPRPAAAKTNQANVAKSSAISSADMKGLIWNDMALPTGDVSSSAVQLRTGRPAEVMVGVPFEYLLEVKNLSSNTLEDVTVVEALGTNFKFESANVRPTGGSGSTLSWTFDELAAGESRLVRVVGSAASESDITSCTTVSYDTNICDTVAVVKPSIKLQKFAPQTISRCEPIALRYVLTNTGSGTAYNLKVNEQLPDGLSLADSSRKVVSFQVPELGAGESKELFANVEASRTGTYRGWAKAMGQGDLAADSGETITVVNEPVLEVSCTGPETSFLGRDFAHFVTVTNKGDGMATDTVVEMRLPSGVEVVDASGGGAASGGKVQWDVGGLRPGDTREYKVTMRASGEATVRTTAFANAECAERVSCQSETRCVGIPAILLEVVDINDPVLVGDNETYEIRVTNQGTAPGTNIRITCELEDGMGYVNADGVTAAAPRGRQIVFSQLASLAPEAKASWRVVVKAERKGSVRFRVQMVSDQIDRPVDETEATNFYQ